MDNIQKSIIFVLLTAGSLAFLLESVDGYSSKEAAPATPTAETASVPPPPPESPPSNPEDGGEEDGDQDEDGDNDRDEEFGDPMVDVDPIDNDDTRANSEDGSSNNGQSGSNIVGSQSGGIGSIGQNANIPIPPPGAPAYNVTGN